MLFVALKHGPFHATIKGVVAAVLPLLNADASYPLLPRASSNESEDSLKNDGDSYRAVSCKTKKIVGQLNMTWVLSEAVLHVQKAPAVQEQNTTITHALPSPIDPGSHSPPARGRGLAIWDGLG
ncbi:hypothetical protein B0O80DRAFT_434358 [Mortierella sp. GBAus27b]|nr:hypothetical protein B0O80DRAFT_434358 [Mortierella sp. GBAus27b]